MIWFKLIEEDERNCLQKSQHSAYASHYSFAALFIHVHPPLRLLWLYRFAHTAAGLSAEALGASTSMETTFWDWSEETEKAVSNWPVCKSIVRLFSLLLHGASSSNAGCGSPQAKFKKSYVNFRLGCSSRDCQSSRFAISATAWKVHYTVHR